MRLLAVVSASMLCLAPMALHAAIEARPLATDSRIHTIMYSPDNVFKFTGHYGYQSSIEFAPDEAIQTISMGDSIAWLLEPSGNRIFLKPLEQNATTNMTVLTNKRSYLFELHAREANGISDPNLVFTLRFLYPTDAEDYLNTTTPEADANEGIPDVNDAEQRAKLNFNYSLRGPEHISPVRVFDDGVFTYFQFRNKNADVPAIFKVDSEQKEALVNYRAQGDYIVVERVAGRFTLRHGADVVCLYNESWSRPTTPGQQAPAAAQTQANRVPTTAPAQY